MYENSPFILCLCFCSYRWSPSPVFHAHSTQNLKGIWEQSVFFSYLYIFKHKQVQQHEKEFLLCKADCGIEADSIRCVL